MFKILNLSEKHGNERMESLVNERCGSGRCVEEKKKEMQLGDAKDHSHQTHTNEKKR